MSRRGAPGELASPYRDVVARQLGREPRGSWRIGAACSWGYPSMIVTAPVLADGTPFPTLYWLTCPWLAEHAAHEESGGAVAAAAERLAADPLAAAALEASDAAYREARAAEAGGTDPCAGTGIAGQKDPLAVKCLHAHVAAALAGTGDPLGLECMGRWDEACPDERCASQSPGPSPRLCPPAR